MSVTSGRDASRRTPVRQRENARRAFVGAALAASLLACGCGAQGSGDHAGAPRTPAAVATTPEPGPTPSPTSRPITIAFGGDVHFEGLIEGRLAKDPASVFGPVSELLSEADLAMVNLESSVTTGGDAAPKAYTFRAPPDAFEALDAAGVDVATMANNHGVDFGTSGVLDSLEAAEKHDFPVVGIGENAEQAYAPYRVTVGGQRLAVIGATQVLNTNLIDEWTATESQPGLASAKDAERLVRAVRAAGRGSDAVVVYLHWGRELESCPLPRQRELARQLVEAGADAIVGGHSHVLLAGGFLDGAYVHYGLGNFVFYNGSGPTAESGVLTLTLERGRVSGARWRPAILRAGQPEVLDGERAEAELAEWRDLRECTDLRARP